MKCTKLMTFALIISMIFPSSIFAQSTCTVCESDKIVVEADEAEAFENDLKQKVETLNGKESGITYKYTYTVKTEIKEEKKDIKNITVDNKFSNEEEALAHYNQIVVEKPFLKGDYNISAVEMPKTETSEEKKLVCKKENCAEEIQNLKDSLESNQTLQIKEIATQQEDGKTEKVVYKENGEIKYFDSKEEAETYQGNYTKDGYRFEKNEYEKVEITQTATKTYEELKGTNTFDTKEQAEESLKAFQTEYGTSNGEVIEEKDESKNKITTGSETFASVEDKEAWIKANTPAKNEGTLVYNTNETTEKYDESTFQNEYNTRKEAEDALNRLKKEGYIVDATITEKVSYLTGKVKNTIKINENNQSYTFGKGTNYVLIKQGSGKYAVWTETPLTENQRKEFVASYNRVTIDGSTKGIKMEDITWIDGYKEEGFDLSHLGNNWGTYYFSKDGDNIILSNPSSKISHVVYGNWEMAKPKYELSGTKYKEKTNYNLTYTKTIYGYVYKINATATVDVKTPKYQIVSTFVEIIKVPYFTYTVETKSSETKYELSYEEYVLEKTAYANIEYEIIKCIQEQTDETVNEVVNVKQNQNYPNPPQTGVETNSLYYILGILIFGLFINFKQLNKEVS